MNEDDRLRSILREWQAPAPSAAIDRRVRASYRGRYRRAWWRRLWQTHISIPVPALAGVLLVVAAALWLQFRQAHQPNRPAALEPPVGGYVSEVQTAGFRALPDGAARVIRAGEAR